MSGLAQAAVSSRNLAFLFTLVFVAFGWMRLDQRFLLTVPWTIEAFGAALLGVILFPIAWAIGMAGGFIGWLFGRRRGRPRDGASGGALGCWLGILLAGALSTQSRYFPLVLLCLLVGPWIGARWLAPLLARIRLGLDRLPAQFNAWAVRYLVWQRPRVDLRGRFVGTVAGLLVGLVSLTAPFQYPEALLLAARVSLRNEPFHTAVGTIEWQRLLERGAPPVRRRLAHLAIVELDDETMARVLAGSSEAALNAQALARLRAWGARQVVVPIATTLPVPPEQTDPRQAEKSEFSSLTWQGLLYRRRPELPAAAVARLRADVPQLISALRATPGALLCPVPVLPGYSEAPLSSEILETLQRAPRVASAEFGLFHVRQLPTLRARDERGRPAVPLLLAARPGRAARRWAAVPPGAQWPPRLRTVRPSEILLNFSGSGPQVVVPHIPYSTLLSGRRIYDPLRGRWVEPARFFRNRTVFLDTVYQPSYSTPVGRLTAMELLVVGLDNLLHANPLAPPPPWAQVLVAVLFGGITGRLALGRSPLRGFFRWTAALVVYLILAFCLFVYPGLWLPIVPVIGAGLLAFLLVNQLVFAVDEEELQRQRARHAQRERELAVSREIQSRLMPEERVQVGDFVLLSRAEPAREVGGDFCGVYRLDGEKRRVGVALGDVAGKGFQGALGMTIATTLLEARAGQATSPAEVLGETNRGLYQRLRGRRMFVTAVYGVLEPETGIWTYASAGQVPPLHLTRDGRASYLPAVGTPLGSLRDSCYTDQHVHLHPGEGVLLASDGFVEARDAEGRPLGYAAFREVVERHMSGSGEELVERLFAETRAATGGQPQDDLTLLLIYRAV